MANWKQTRDYDGPLLTEEFQREDGAFRVGSNKFTREKQRPYYVQSTHGGRHFTSDINFRRRFTTAEAAMTAVDKKNPA